MSPATSRGLHRSATTTLSSHTLTSEIERRSEGKTLVLLHRKPGVCAFDPEQEQIGGGDSELTLPDRTEVYRGSTEELANPRVDGDRYDTVILILGPVDPFKRHQLFYPASSLVRVGGTLLTATGLEPTVSPDHDAHWWVGDSKLLSEPEIVVTRYEGCKTPEVLASYTRVRQEEDDGN